MFIGQIDSIDYARVRVKPFRRGRVLVKGFTRKLTRDKDFQKDAIVSTAALAGSKVGFLTAGPAGGVAGDFIGATATRKAINDTTALKRAINNIKTQEGTEQLSKLQKMRLLHQESKKELANMARKRRRDAVGDVGGFVAGNLAGAAIGIPLSGVIPGALGAKASQRLEAKVTEVQSRLMKRVKQ